MVVRTVMSMLLAGCAALGSGCGGIHIVHRSADLAPRRALEPGVRVRVHVAQPRSTVVGYVTRVGPDTLVVTREQDAENELVLPASNVRRVDLSVGKRSRRGRGALVGVLAGAALGVAALAFACKHECVGAWPLLGLPPGGALVGAGTGAGIGSLIKTERWREVEWR